MPGGHAGHKGAHAGHNGGGEPGGDKGKAWAEALSEEERAVVKGYGQDGFIRINGALRKGGVPEPETIVIDRALKPLEEDMVVFRGGINPGKGVVFRDKAFASTTMDQKMLDNSAYDALWEIRVSKGTKVGWVNYAMGNVGTALDEKELLLQRNLKYRILSREKAGDKMKIVAEVIGL